MKKWLPRIVILLTICAFSSPAMAEASQPDGKSKQPAQSAVKVKKSPLKILRQAAQNGDAVSQNKLGTLYAKGKGVNQSYAMAAKWYEKAAIQGNALAQYNLGESYAEGHGVRRSYVKAAKWYEKAAVQGNSQAQVGLGILYSDGRGVKRDYHRAEQLLIKAADQWNANGMASLGILYELGLGVPRDHIKAYALYILAVANGGHHDAVFYRNRMRAYIDRAGRARAEALMQEMTKARNVSAVLNKK